MVILSVIIRVRPRLFDQFGHETMYASSGNKAPLHTKLTLMDCGIGNTNLLGSSSSGLAYDSHHLTQK